jgi:HAD superfamily hydrolase (TIGR01509 family)
MKDIVKEELNIDLKSKDIGKIAGMTYTDKLKLLLKDKNIEFDVNDLSKKIYERFKHTFESQIKLRSGAKELLNLLSGNGFKIGLYSPNQRSVIETSLRKCGVIKFFDLIVSREDIEKPKPDPEGYLLAAKKLNVKPENCLVFEDTPTGFTSAVNAGMKVVVLNNPYLENPKYPGADKLIDGFDGLNMDFFEKF